MCADLGNGKLLDDALGVIGLTPLELPPLPDAAITDREAGRLDPRRWFPSPAQPLEIEIGCGKGTFLVNHAPRYPDRNMLGIEWGREYYMYTADRLRRRGVTNVRMMHADATEFLKWRCPGSIASVIHLYFSDPWPKRKHHKNRVIQDSFLTEAWRVLIPGGELRIVTDHDELWAWDEEHFARWTTASGRGVPQRIAASVPATAPFERLAFTPPEWVGDGEMVGTNYERKFQREDRPAHACTLRAHKPAS
jgi:tRNA (guanine-N7-)-methyltransferase